MKFFFIIKNFLTNPYSSLRYVILKRINKKLKDKFKKEYKIEKYLTNNSLFEPQYYDLENLINLIKSIKPKYILELGGGFSTVAISYALDYNKKKFRVDGKLISYDQSKYYLDLTKKILPKKYKKLVLFKYSKLKLINFKKERVSVFKKIIHKNYNLVYEDRFDHKKTRIGADILFMEKKIDSECSYVVDGHRFTVKFLKKYLTKKYSIKTNKLYFRTNFINLYH
ncbi:hypothetical protein [Candidatus Pelagibacter sp. Uisw_113]|uniref:hypothetical protein n=1 Tax=Candidatus Pelagibacter sp. Uisw_113 TaxID=3230994 RepID=UPI0039ED3BB3